MLNKDAEEKVCPYKFQHMMDAELSQLFCETDLCIAWTPTVTKQRYIGPKVEVGDDGLHHHVNDYVDIKHGYCSAFQDKS